MKATMQEHEVRQSFQTDRCSISEQSMLWVRRSSGRVSSFYCCCSLLAFSRLRIRHSPACVAVAGRGAECAAAACSVSIGTKSDRAQESCVPC